jgi:CheY-like chemotaxis protein/anti-sigma regulatory factor (Ser/Thr protein kinase)
MAQLSSEALRRIIDDILDFSKIEANKLDVEAVPFDLRELVDSVSYLLAEKAGAAGIEVTCVFDQEVPRFIVSDPVRIRQVLLNLAGNALKFTHQGKVVIRIRRLKQNGADRLHCSVTDTGRGIEVEFLPHLFEPFTQEDTSTTRRYGGTGLGLSITKRLIDLLGGEIGVESELGRGSVFWFTLPLVPATGEQPGWTADSDPQRESSGEVPAARVLVVEDNLVNQRVVRRMLETDGHRVEVASHGREALAALERRHFDVILMDCQMPGMDGYEATAAIRRLEAATNRRIPIIAFTAHAMRGDRERCMAAGMDDYLVKPIQREQLRRVLRRWLVKAQPATISSA